MSQSTINTRTVIKVGDRRLAILTEELVRPEDIILALQRSGINIQLVNSRKVKSVQI